MKPTKTVKCCELWRGLRFRPWRSLIYTFTAFTVLLTFIDRITYFLPNIPIDNEYTLIMISLVSLLFCVSQIWKPSSVIIKVATTNTEIEVLFGDLFDQSDGLRGIAVTEFFESELGSPVSEESLHGMFLKKFFEDERAKFDKQLKKQLKNISSKDVAKKYGKTKSYPIGTTALIETETETETETKCGTYILFASAEADPNTLKASSDVTKMCTAMHGLWQRARIASGGKPLIIPLIGSGISGIGLPARDLLNLIILSVITETKVKQITEKIRIVLYFDQFQKIDLRDIKKYWEES